MADALTTERLDELEATALNSGAKRHIADWSPDPVRDYVSRLEAFARETAPMADELAKIAADVGEDGDPFAAWESIEALKASARRLPEVERELAEARATYSKVLQTWAESRQRHLAAESDLAASRKIVSRIWELFGNPEYVPGGASIYDRVQAGIDAEAEVARLKEALAAETEAVERIAETLGHLHSTVLDAECKTGDKDEILDIIDDVGNQFDALRLALTASSALENSNG